MLSTPEQARRWRGTVTRPLSSIGCCIVHDAAALTALACPVCRAGLSGSAGFLSCDGGHRFDIARQGHVNLLGGKGSVFTGDNAQMVADRVAFLTAGHYLPIVHAIAEVAADVSAPGVVLDAGAGPGWYLGQLLARLPGRSGISCDVSVYAARRSAKVALSLVCDAWQRLPLADDAVAVLLNIFAPRHPGEFARVLHPDGLLLVVTPQGDHLTELVTAFDLIHVDQTKTTRLAQTLSGHFELLTQRSLRWQMQLQPPAIGQLIGMGPNGFHRSAPVIADTEMVVTAAVTVGAYRVHRGYA